jgi:hypothetical protein
MLEIRRATANRIASVLGDHENVSAVLIFGSVASGHVDNRSDVDLLFVCRSDIVSLPDRRGRLSRLGAEWLFHDQRDDNPIFADRDSDGLVDGIRVTVGYQSARWIGAVLDQVLNQGAITSKEMPFRPYTLPALLQRGLVLLDKDREIERWRARVRIYPPHLRQNILRHFTPLLREYVEEMVATAERDLGPQGMIYFLFRASDAMRSILFTLNDTYDPADRRMDRTVVPHLPRLPKDYAKRLEYVLVGPFDRLGTMERSRLFKQLADEVIKMVDDDPPDTH